MTLPELVRSRAVASRLEAVPSTGSTNTDLVAAAVAAPERWPHLAVLATDHQTAGRGRLGRRWQAPPGSSLAVSVLLRPADLVAGAFPADAYGWIPLLAGVAMVRAVRAQGVADAELKWPNDVLVGGAKLSGILAELLPDAAGVVVGAGVNLGMTREQLPVESATSLHLLGVARPDVDALLADYLEGLRVAVYELACAGGDADGSGIRGLVERECATVGRAVRLELPGGQLRETRATGIDSAGRLVVITDDGTAAIAAGDVTHLRY